MTRDGAQLLLLLLLLPPLLLEVAGTVAYCACAWVPSRAACPASRTACSASLESPLASRNDVLVILPAPLDDSDLEEKIKTADSIAIIKIGRHFERIKELLKRNRLIQNAQYIERATMQSQKIIDIEKVDAKSTPYFSMILIHSRKKAWL